MKENFEKDANDTPVVNEKIVEEKLNTISVAVLFFYFDMDAIHSFNFEVDAVHFFVSGDDDEFVSHVNDNIHC